MSLYVGATGLMWENAPDFNALLVFAEHRFYGESLPFGAPDKGREFLRQDGLFITFFGCRISGNAYRNRGYGGQGWRTRAFPGSR